MVDDKAYILGALAFFFNLLAVWILVRGFRIADERKSVEYFSAGWVVYAIQFVCFGEAFQWVHIRHFDSHFVIWISYSAALGCAIAGVSGFPVDEGDKKRNIKNI